MREKISWVDLRVLTRVLMTMGAKTSHIGMKGSQVDGRKFSRRCERVVGSGGGDGSGGKWWR